MTKAIPLEESISNIEFFDKTFFIKECQNNFPQRIIVKIDNDDLDELIPLFITVFKMKLKGFVVLAKGKKEIISKFCKNLELKGIPDVEMTNSNEGFVLSATKPKNKFEIQVNKLGDSNSQIVSDAKKYLNFSKEVTLKEIKDNYISETQIILKQLNVSMSKTKKFEETFNADAKKTYLFLLKNQPTQLLSSSAVCNNLGFTIAQYLTAIRKLFELEIIIRKGDIFIPIYDQILIKNKTNLIKL
jgi:hypothetical protein